jgi:hypothetical protein
MSLITLGDSSLCTFTMTSDESSTIFPIDVFDNQFQFGKTIAQRFSDNSNLTYLLAFALTQSGKTGAMLSTIHHFLNDPSLTTSLDNIFILTGISSIEWVQQTKQRFPESLHHRIYHRNNLIQFFIDIESKRDILIILDEVHIATKHDQTIASIFKALRFDDVPSLLANSVRFVFFTATPNNISFFIDNPNADIVQMHPPSSYTSIFDLLRNDQVLPFKDLSILDNVIDLKHFILSRFSTPKYHIIRTHNNSFKNNFKQRRTIFSFKQVWGKHAHFIIDDLSFDFNSFLSSTPSRHTFIFIKERLRCAKTITKSHIGVLYERLTYKPNINSIIQGLAGRATGYDSHHQLVVFSHLPSILLYFDIWNNDPSYKQSNLLFR